MKFTVQLGFIYALIVVLANPEAALRVFYCLVVLLYVVKVIVSWSRRVSSEPKPL